MTATYYSNLKLLVIAFPVGPIAHQASGVTLVDAQIAAGQYGLTLTVR